MQLTGGVTYDDIHGSGRNTASHVTPALLQPLQLELIKGFVQGLQEPSDSGPPSKTIFHLLPTEVIRRFTRR